MKETRAQLAAAMLNHGMVKLNEAQYQPAFRDHEMATVKVGSFEVIHCRPVAHWNGGDELFDIAQGSKVLAMRRDSAQQNWQLVSMKRGDWESAFLLT